MKANGRTTKQKGRGDSTTKMVISTKVLTRITSLTDTGSTITMRRRQNILGTILMTNLMARVGNSGQMEQYFKGCTETGERMAMASLPMRMEVHT